MKHSISPNPARGLAVNLESLCALKPDELAERWRSLFGSDPPARLRRPLLIQALAYRLQGKAFGGLKPATRRVLESLAGDANARRPVIARATARVRPGAVLIREWHGTKHQVTALKDGFMFSGKRFQSLSKIASEITGTRWSGPLFFGLKTSRSEEQYGTR
jgi:hypothetical protein